MAPNHDILLGDPYLSQDTMLDVCFTMYSALEAQHMHWISWETRVRPISISAITLEIVPMMVVGVISIHLVV